MTKVVLNDCYGGFGLSPEAMQELYSRKGIECHIEKDRRGRSVVKPVNESERISEHYIDREDADLIALIEEKGGEFCSGKDADLVIEEYDEENFTYTINEYDGCESLELIPMVNEKKLEGKTTSEICNYLEDLGIYVNRKTTNNKAN